MTAATEPISSSIAFLVNGDSRSAMAQRARAFAAHLGSEYVSEIYLRRGSRAAAAVSYIRALLTFRPSTVYVLDLTLPALVAAFYVRRQTRCRVVIDTGDATAALVSGRSVAGRLLFPALAAYEWSALRAADAVVVRGTVHAQHLEGRGIHAAVIPDGADMATYRPRNGDRLRERLGLSDRFVVGVVGSLNWNRRLEWCTGLELVDALAAVRSTRIAGLIVGNGSGLARLRSRAAQLGVSDRIQFVSDWLDSEPLAAHICAMDVCLSTQTNDIVGRVRTTGKLPLFLSCGRFVLATRVGEAARVLPDEMLLDYSGGFDPSYPRRLAERLDELVSERSLVSGERGREIAATEFDYRVLGCRVADVLRGLAGNLHAA